MFSADFIAFIIYQTITSEYKFEFGKGSDSLNKASFFFLQ